MSHFVRNSVLGFLTMSKINRAVQPQTMASGLKFRIKEVEGWYYPCMESKGADQMCTGSYRAADLCL